MITDFIVNIVLIYMVISVLLIASLSFYTSRPAPRVNPSISTIYTSNISTYKQTLNNIYGRNGPYRGT
jgi:hypothetical protein